MKINPTIPGLATTLALIATGVQAQQPSGNGDKFDRPATESSAESELKSWFEPAELFKADLMVEFPVAQALSLAERAVKSAESASATVDRLAPEIERALGVAETAPKLIAAEREAALKALHDELTRAIESVQQERTAAFEQISRERVAALKELHEAMTAERLALTQDIAQISLKLVDHAFWRAAQLLAVVLVVLAIGLTVVASIFKRTRIRNL